MTAAIDIEPGAGHRLRSPLNVIIGFTGTLLMKLPGPLTSEQERQLRMIQASAKELLEEVNAFVEKVSSGKEA